MADNRHRTRAHLRQPLKRLAKSVARQFSAGRKPGTPAGIEHAEQLAATSQTPVTYEVIDYDEKTVSRYTPGNVEELIALPAAPPTGVRWINVTGLDARVINRLRQHLKFHTLAAEDVLHVPQRPQAVVYDDHFFVVLRMLSMLPDQELKSEQVSMFIYERLVVTFQEDSGDPWNNIRARIEKPNSRMRTRRADYLAYCLLDAIVDHCFPILEIYDTKLDEIEEEILGQPSAACIEQLYRLKRHLLLIRRAIWPVRELLENLQRDEETGIFADETCRFLRDVSDHAIQVVEVLETYRELAGSLTDMYMSIMSIRMNQVMKVLTLVTTVFVPVTFLAGVYGMNFEFMPELHSRAGYPIFWSICLVMMLSMLWFFQRRGWFKT